MECGILAIKKTSMKTLQIGVYSAFLNVPIKKVQGKDNCNIEKNKNNDFLCQLYFLRLYLFWLTPCIFVFFLFVNTRHDNELIKVKH